MSEPSGTIASDLKRLHGMWQCPRGGEPPYHTTFWSQTLGHNVPYLSIQDSRFGGADKPYPVFPFFTFEVREEGGTCAIVPKDFVTLGPPLRAIPFHFAGDEFVVESGTIVVRHGNGQDEVALKGAYRFAGAG